MSVNEVVRISNVLHVQCEKHGTHPHAITSAVKGFEGAYCQLCWLETLGPPLHTVYREADWNWKQAIKAKGEKA
jgi:hypothetical protein